MKSVTNIIRVLFLGLFIFLVIKGKMMLWFALYAISLFAALIFGRIYCGYACPMNTLMAPAEFLSRKMKWQKDQSPKWLISGIFPWFALVGSIVVMLLAKKILHIDIPILLVWTAVAVLLTLKFKPAVFHNLICPFGILQKFFGKFARKSKKVIVEQCTGCKKCESPCPSDAILVDIESKKAQIQTAICLQCINCKEACPFDAIKYS